MLQLRDIALMLAYGRLASARGQASSSQPCDCWGHCGNQDDPAGRHSQTGSYPAQAIHHQGSPTFRLARSGKPLCVCVVRPGGRQQQPAAVDWKLLVGQFRRLALSMGTFRCIAKPSKLLQASPVCNAEVPEVPEFKVICDCCCLCRCWCAATLALRESQELSAQVTLSQVATENFWHLRCLSLSCSAASQHA